EHRPYPWLHTAWMNSSLHPLSESSSGAFLQCSSGHFSKSTSWSRPTVAQKSASSPWPRSFAYQRMTPSTVRACWMWKGSELYLRSRARAALLSGHAFIFDRSPFVKSDRGGIPGIRVALQGDEVVVIGQQEGEILFQAVHDVPAEQL